MQQRTNYCCSAHSEIDWCTQSLKFRHGANSSKTSTSGADKSALVCMRDTDNPPLLPTYSSCSLLKPREVSLRSKYASFLRTGINNNLLEELSTNSSRAVRLLWAFLIKAGEFSLLSVQL